MVLKHRKRKASGRLGLFKGLLAFFLLDMGLLVVRHFGTARTQSPVLIAYAALAPLIRQSGSSLNKNTGTHPQGHRDLRRALYFHAMVAGQHNPLIAAFWQRLKAQNKPGKVIVVACMHKLLAIAYAVLKSGKPFNPDYLKPMNA